MSTQNDTETEVKIALPQMDQAAVRELLRSKGLGECVPRLFEANSVYDTNDKSLRASQMLLRLRQVGNRNVITWKGPVVPGPHKSRPEIETEFTSFAALDQILKHLGYSVFFRYEKYRTEYQDQSGVGTVTFDETPIGNFLELEGQGSWIDRTAKNLGFTPEDYLLESYGRLYLEHCGKLGLPPSHMTFASYTE